MGINENCASSGKLFSMPNEPGMSEVKPESVIKICSNEQEELLVAFRV